MYNRVISNCSNILGDNDKTHKKAMLKDSGNHLEDPIYKKLHSHFMYLGGPIEGYIEETGPITEAMSRIERRTMTEDEYNLIKRHCEEEKDDFELKYKLRELLKK
jgi:hypothetical protein